MTFREDMFMFIKMQAKRITGKADPPKSESQDPWRNMNSILVEGWRLRLQGAMLSLQPGQEGLTISAQDPMLTHIFLLTASLYVYSTSPYSLN